jgi:hypothetical protein
LLRVFELVDQVAPLLVAERFAVGDEKLKVAGVRRITARPAFGSRSAMASSTRFTFPM